MNNSKIIFGVETLVVNKYKGGQLVEERYFTPEGFLEFLYELADEYEDKGAHFVVKSRQYEVGEDTPPSIFYGKIVENNGKWDFKLDID